MLSPTEEQDRADWCFEVWLRLWETFGGFAFPTYECVISDRLVPVGTAPSGHATWSRFPARALGARVAEATWKSLISHEIVHSWNFGHIGIDELWFAEGMSEYYRWLVTDFENAGRNVASYFQTYVRQRGVGQDGPLAGATREKDANLAYYKGMLVFHMLDVEMSERSRGAKSLDNALRRLYLQVGTRGIPPGIRPPPLPRSLFRDAIVAEVGSSDEIDRFFADYVEGTRDLAEWRDGRLKLPVALIPSHPPVAY